MTKRLLIAPCALFVLAACRIPLALVPGELQRLHVEREKRALPPEICRATPGAELYVLRYVTEHEESVLIDEPTESGTMRMMEELMDYAFLFTIHIPFFVKEGLAAGVLFLPGYSAHVGDLLESPLNFAVWQVPALLLPHAYGGSFKGRVSKKRLEEAVSVPTGGVWVTDATPTRVELVRIRSTEP